MKISFLKLLFASILFISPLIVLAGNAQNLSGFAWSSNIGWISMNNTTGGGAVDYGVHKAPDGRLCGNSACTIPGYAWSDNIGWIKFGGLSNFPTGGGTVAQNARVNSAGTGLEGWARACAGMSDPGNCVDVVPTPTTPPATNAVLSGEINANDGSISCVSRIDAVLFSVITGGIINGEGNQIKFNAKCADLRYTRGATTVLLSGSINLSDGVTITPMGIPTPGGPLAGACASNDGRKITLYNLNDSVTGLAGSAVDLNVSGATVAQGPQEYNSPGGRPFYCGGNTGAKGARVRINRVYGEGNRLVFARGSQVVTSIIFTPTAIPTTAPIDPRGGWDGWISLKGTTPNYGVNFTEGGDFSGYAWGSDVVGWVDFNGVSLQGMYGTLSSTSCIIPSGASGCDVTLSWTTSNPEAVSVITSSTPLPNTIIATGNSGTQSTVAVPYPSRTFYLYNNGQELTSTTVTAVCTERTSWDTTLNKCVQSPLNMDLKVSGADLNRGDHNSEEDALRVSPGERIYFTWTSSGALGYSCSSSIGNNGITRIILPTQPPPGLFISAPGNPGLYTYSAQCTQDTAMRTIDKFVSFFLKPAFADTINSDTVYVMVDEPTQPPMGSGVCLPTHYNCSSAKASTNRLSSPSRFTWICPGSDDTMTTDDVQCVERKRPGFIEE